MEFKWGLKWSGGLMAFHRSFRRVKPLSESFMEFMKTQRVQGIFGGSIKVDIEGIQINRTITLK